RQPLRFPICQDHPTTKRLLVKLIPATGVVIQSLTPAKSPVTKKFKPSDILPSPVVLNAMNTNMVVTIPKMPLKLNVPPKQSTASQPPIVQQTNSHPRSNKYTKIRSAKLSPPMSTIPSSKQSIKDC